MRVLIAYVESSFAVPTDGDYPSIRETLVAGTARRGAAVPSVQPFAPRSVAKTGCTPCWLAFCFAIHQPPLVIAPARS